MIKRTVLFIAAIVILFLLLHPFYSFAETSPSAIVNEIDNALDKAYKNYSKGNKLKAKAQVSEVYFDIFEGKGLEGAIGARLPSEKTRIESLFGQIIGLIDSSDDPIQVKTVIDELMGQLAIISEALSKNESSSNGLSLFINSLIIIVREGFEAILIISALVVYLVKIGQATKVWIIYAGGGVALLASLLVAIIFHFFFSTAGASKEAVEGITMLVATGVLFYVSYWLISKVRVARWQKYIKSKVEGSLSKGSVYTLGFAAFLAVFREGAETVLFYQALYSSANGNTNYLFIGLGAGIVILICIFLIFRYGTVKIPLGAFFAVTSTLLYYLAFTFAGKGIIELQGASLISTTPIKWFSAIDFLGIYPTWEGISIQLLLLIALLVAIVYSFLIKPYKEREESLKEVSHIAFDISNLHDILRHIRAHARKCQELSPKTGSGEEVQEMRGHLNEIDTKVHEVLDHLHQLEEALTDIFNDLEQTVKKP